MRKKPVQAKRMSSIAAFIFIPIWLLIPMQPVEPIEEEVVAIPTVVVPLGSSNMIETSLLVNLPQVRILPDSPFYHLKRSWEEVYLFLVRSPEQKMDFLLHLSEVRLAEAIHLLKAQKNSLAEQVYSEYQARIQHIQDSFSTTVDATQLSQRLHNQQEKNQLFTLLLGEYQLEWRRR